MCNILFYMSSRSVTWLHMQIPQLCCLETVGTLIWAKKHYFIKACVSLLFLNDQLIAKKWKYKCDSWPFCTSKKVVYLDKSFFITNI